MAFATGQAQALLQKNAGGRSDGVAAAGKRSRDDFRSMLVADRAGKRSRDEVDQDSQLTDALFGHLSKKCTTRELVGLRSVCTTWDKLVSANTVITARARWEDSATDWYFPVRSQVVKCLAPVGQRPSFPFSRTWAGVHHSSGEVHTLPSLMHLPEEFIDDWSFDSLIASSGGLLLLIDNQRLPMLTSTISPTGTKLIVSNPPLIISNPLTKRWKELPEFGCGIEAPSWDYVGMRAHLDVDERANSYRVILMFPTGVCVYKSTTNTWTTLAPFCQPVPWGVWLQGSSRFCAMPSAFVDNTLFVAELEVEGDTEPQTHLSTDVSFLTTGCVRVFEVDVDSGTWKPPVQYPLRNYLSTSVPGVLPNLPPAALPTYGFRIGSYGIGLVECMGSLFAVIPARLDTAEEMGADLRRMNGVENRPGSFESFGFLPLRFYVLRLEGTVGVRFGQLLVQLPQDRVDPEWRNERRLSLPEDADGDYAVGDWLWRDPCGSSFSSRNLGFFRCTARGAVIWLTWSDYLLQFDVLLGKSSTQILPDLSFSSEPDLSYRPSFYMNP